MKKPFVTLISCLAFASSFAETTSPLKNIYKEFDANALYNFRNFTFDSTNGSNLNRFDGHTNMVGFGGDNFTLNDNLHFGVYAYRSRTNMSSDSYVGGFSPLSHSHIKTWSNTVYGHAMRRVTDKFYLDAAIGRTYNNSYHYNTLKYSKELNAALEDQTAYTGYNWFGMLSAYTAQVFKYFTLKENARAMYSYTFQDPYRLSYNVVGFFFTNNIMMYTNKTWLAMEDAELAFTKSSTWTPYISGGLLQVLNFKSNTDSSLITVVGGAPEFNLDQNGYHWGGGISCSSAPFTVRFDYSHFVRGHVYKSDQLTLSLRVHLD